MWMEGYIGMSEVYPTIGKSGDSRQRGSTCMAVMAAVGSWLATQACAVKKVSLQLRASRNNNL